MMHDLSKLCIHTITTKPLAIEDAVLQYAAAGIGGITVWRDALAGRNVRDTGDMIRDNGLKIVSLCRGGFFPHRDVSKRRAAVDENRRVIAEAVELNAPMIVLVCGADPGQSLEDSREQIFESISELIPEAAASGVRLAIEPLHPMYADTRSAINTLGQANDMAERINSEWVGVAIDVYHTWWDPALQQEIMRCGANKNLFAFHICDWKVPTTDLLNDRGLMGEGCIPVPLIRSWVEAAGFTGFNEVEIFSTQYWKEDQSEFIHKIITAYQQNS